MRWMNSLLFGTVLIVAAYGIAAATWSASVSGRVVDVKTLQPVANAKIEMFTETGDQVIGKATSDASGGFAIGGLRGGMYRISFQKHGYQRTVVAGVEVKPGAHLIEAAPIAMYPNGVPVPRAAAGNTQCGDLIQPLETADVYVFCSGD